MKDAHLECHIQSHNQAANGYPACKLWIDDNVECPRKPQVYLITLLITGLCAIKYLWKRTLSFVGVDKNCAYTLKFLPWVIKICISHFCWKERCVACFRRQVPNNQSSNTPESFHSTQVQNLSYLAIHLQRQIYKGWKGGEKGGITFLSEYIVIGRSCMH